MDSKKLSYIFGLFGLTAFVTLAVLLGIAYFLGWPFEEEVIPVKKYPAGVESPDYPAVEPGKG